MFTSRSAVFIVSATAMVALASPIDLISRAFEASPIVQVCTGGAGVGCVNIPVISSNCVNFTGGLTFLNKEVSTATVPDGYVCTFFQNFGCLAPQGGGDVVLQGGTTNFFQASGTAATVSFNDVPILSEGESGIWPLTVEM